MREIHKTRDLGNKAILEDVLRINSDTLFKYSTFKRCSGTIYKNVLLSAEMFVNDFYKIKLDDGNDMTDKQKRRANKN